MISGTLPAWYEPWTVIVGGVGLALVIEFAFIVPFPVTHSDDLDATSQPGFD
ncbi:hypothetical protein [Mesorhizobium sp. M2E.F.Ca.ET.209.01.1.1]|uniref:hypothetical protein n=1 Tax=Mesorhizobium sp. M2E.F.Ca.ET.209.01.1.1 TaxID=2500526 RepID=UPI00167A8CB3|nr:hypothetical protein [Mesorhizobium sp. M2E.F.Ca.ET.209.01.1.1]